MLFNMQLTQGFAIEWNIETLKEVTYFEKELKIHTTWVENRLFVQLKWELFPFPSAWAPGGGKGRVSGQQRSF